MEKTGHTIKEFHMLLTDDETDNFLEKPST
jgi:hypothetical protein